MNRASFIKKVRDFELRLQANMEQIMCPTHLSLGHEEVAADIWENIRPDDWLFSTHRNHHHYLAKGGDETRLFGEIMGSPEGINGGFAGSQSISDPLVNFHASAIVGGLVGVGIGVAISLLGHPKNAIAVVVVGDGGTEQGVFWEALNFAALHSLPIAFICENNGMSVDSPIAERQYAPLPDRVKAFGIDVHQTVEMTIRSARTGVPAFCECKVKLECDHLNMSTLLPSLGLS